jgi:hypothetical protein
MSDNPLFRAGRRPVPAVDRTGKPGGGLPACPVCLRAWKIEGGGCLRAVVWSFTDQL